MTLPYDVTAKAEQTGYDVREPPHARHMIGYYSIYWSKCYGALFHACSIQDTLSKTDDKEIGYITVIKFDLIEPFKRVSVKFFNDHNHLLKRPLLIE